MSAEHRALAAARSARRRSLRAFRGLVKAFEEDTEGRLSSRDRARVAAFHLDEAASDADEAYRTILVRGMARMLREGR